jgi:hypothetical protein
MAENLNVVKHSSKQFVDNYERSMRVISCDCPVKRKVVGYAGYKAGSMERIPICEIIPCDCKGKK